MSGIRISVSSRARDLAVSTAVTLLGDVGTPYALSVRDVLLSDDHSPLLGLEIDPRKYACSADFRADYLAAELMSKFPKLKVKVDRKARAMDGFLAAEQSCTSVNRKIQRYDQWGTFTPLAQAAIFSARAKIASALGPFSWDEAEGHFGFGPGATFSLSRRFGDAYYKFGHKPSVTRASAELAYAAIRRIPTWFMNLCQKHGHGLGSVGCHEFIRDCLTIVPGNRVVTVPKSAKTDRVIAIEPCMNIFLQRGIGRCMRGRLKRNNIDLDSQLLNQELALEGSKTGLLSTIDLSSASDSISMGLVEMLLPTDWVRAIKLTRSPRGTLPDGTLVTYQKVSSMGNGFTFELETLLFWGLLVGVMSSLQLKGRISVYGDDIICPTAVASPLMGVLNELGFTSNAKKTFIDGPFRESCGKHYFRGCDVTPFYVRSEVNTVMRYIWYANSIKLWSARASVWGLHPSGYNAYVSVVRAIPKSIRRLAVPVGLGDLALIKDFDEARPSFHQATQSYTANCLSVVLKKRQPQDVPLLLRGLYNMEGALASGSVEQSSIVEGRVANGGVPIGHRYAFNIVHTVQWPDLGPWLNTVD